MIPKDPYMLLSWVNMKLRDEYESLDELCKAQDISKEELEKKLSAIDYLYQPESNQFK